MRDPDSTSYLASFAPADQFATQVAAEARRRGADAIRQLVVLGDGAPWIWTLATAILPEATPIVDLYHAREHLHDLATHLSPVLGDAHPDWLAARLADLDNGDIETLVTETARLLPQLPDDIAHDTTKALGYFKTNAHRMRYGYFRDHGLFVGSGVVEAAEIPGRSTPQTVRHALEHPRRHRHPHPAANRPATASTTSGHSRTTRPPPTPPHDQQANDPIQDQRRFTYKSVAHPHQNVDGSMFVGRLD